MAAPRQSSLASSALLVLLAAGLALLGACSSDPETADDAGETVFVTQDATCDHALNTPVAQTINERVGGLRTPDFVVHFSQTTKVGNVALVTGDVPKAFDVLSQDYGVAVVAELEESDSGGIVGFEQVRRLVEDVCGPE